MDLGAVSISLSSWIGHVCSVINAMYEIIWPRELTMVPAPCSEMRWSGSSRHTLSASAGRIMGFFLPQRA